MKRKVALVLSSGGARGFAHIGAIEALEERGYEIASVAGASMGALVGGAYAAGRLDALREWLYGLTARQVVGLMDVRPGLNHLVRGDRAMEALRRVVPDCRIEELPLPYRAIAADISRNREVMFSRGSLLTAIRASVAIPTFLRPLRTKKRVLIDGGIVNPLPLNRAVRTPGDLLVAVNVSAPADPELEAERREAAEEREGVVGAAVRMLFPHADEAAGNYFTLLTKTFALMIQQHTALAVRLTPPDVRVDIPMNRFGGFDFDKAERIARAGRAAMREALARYEAGRADTAG